LTAFSCSLNLLLLLLRFGFNVWHNGGLLLSQSCASMMAAKNVWLAAVAARSL
jgi:hypothetical protein